MQKVLPSRPGEGGGLGQDAGTFLLGLCSRRPWGLWPRAPFLSLHFSREEPGSPASASEQHGVPSRKGQGLMQLKQKVLGTPNPQSLVVPKPCPGRGPWACRRSPRCGALAHLGGAAGTAGPQAVRRPCPPPRPQAGRLLARPGGLFTVRPPTMPACLGVCIPRPGPPCLVPGDPGLCLPRWPPSASSPTSASSFPGAPALYRWVGTGFCQGCLHKRAPSPSAAGPQCFSPRREAGRARPRRPDARRAAFSMPRPGSVPSRCSPPFAGRFSLLKLPCGSPERQPLRWVPGRGRRVSGHSQPPVPPGMGAEALLSSSWTVRLSRCPLPRPPECGVAPACPGSRALACPAPGPPVSVGPGGRAGLLSEGLMSVGDRHPPEPTGCSSGLGRGDRMVSIWGAWGLGAGVWGHRGLLPVPRFPPWRGSNHPAGPRMGAGTQRRPS